MIPGPSPTVLARTPSLSSLGGGGPNDLFAQPPNVDFGSDHMNSEYAYLSNMLLDPVFAELGANGGQTRQYDLVELGSLANSTTYTPAPTMQPQLPPDPLSQLLNPVMRSVSTTESMLATSAVANPTLHMGSPRPPQQSPVSHSLTPIQRTNEVYASVTRPYDYREGYRYLLKYVKERCLYELGLGLCFENAHQIILSLQNEETRYDTYRESHVAISTAVPGTDNVTV